jgi:hypothetical protein
MILLGALRRGDPDGGAGRGDDHGLDRHVLMVVDQEPAHAPHELVARDADDRRAGGGDAQPRHRRAAGVLLSGVFFASKIAQIFRVTSELSQDGRARRYIVQGQLFYASVEDFNAAFDFREALDTVTIDVSRAHIWDISSVAAIDMVVLKFRREGATVELVGMNEASETIVDRLALHDKPGALEKLQAH